MSEHPEISEALLRMASQRAEKTFCPSEVARALSSNWRPLMPAIRQEAQYLVDSGKLDCLQSGKAVSPLQARGPIRLRKRLGR